MERSLSLIGCGLLVVALGSVGCSSKKSNGTPDSGSAGSSSTAGTSGGGAGKGTGGAGGTKADAGGTLTAAECTTMTVAKMVPMACASCVCTKNTAAAAACLKDAQCWNLINCVGSKCGGDAMATMCITGMCASSLAGATTATAVMIPTMCKTECGASSPTPDAGGTGHDAGN